MPKKTPAPSSPKNAELIQYGKTLLFSFLVFGLTYGYISYQGIPSALNKAVADTAVVVMGLSMGLTALCYFFNIFDRFISYRKHLGLVGFGFAVVHLLLSWSAFMRLFVLSNWQQGSIWPVATAAGATIIFSIMSLMSVNWIARTVGGKTWKLILRAGYLALALVAIHVFLLKANRWATWWKEEPLSLPSASLVAFIIIILVIGGRVILELSARNKKGRA